MTLFIIGITESINVTDVPFCKHEDLQLVWERKSIVETLSKIYEVIKNLTQTVVISESKLRKVIPRLTTQTTVISSVVAVIKGKFIILTETISISDSISRFYKSIRSMIETITISDFVATRNPLAVFIMATIKEADIFISERLIANTAGPSWRWRFQPWKKSSMDNDFEPARHYPRINVTGPVGESIKMVVITIKQRLPYIFKFKED